MDVTRYNHPDLPPPLRLERSRANAQTAEVRVERNVPPFIQWQSQVPGLQQQSQMNEFEGRLPQRQQQQVDFTEHAPFAWRLHSPVRAKDDTSLPSPAPIRQRATKRPQALRSIVLGHQESNSHELNDLYDFAVAYPQLSPYDETISALNVHISSNAQGHRSISQPSTPSWLAHIERRQSSAPEMQHSIFPPPPLSSSTTTSNPGRDITAFGAGAETTDDAFHSHSDYQLFVAATSGLSPEQPFRHALPPSSRLHTARWSRLGGHGQIETEQQSHHYERRCEEQSSRQRDDSVSPISPSPSLRLQRTGIGAATAVGPVAESDLPRHSAPDLLLRRQDSVTQPSRHLQSQDLARALQQRYAQGQGQQQRSRSGDSAIPSWLTELVSPVTPSEDDGSGGARQDGDTWHGSPREEAGEHWEGGGGGLPYRRGEHSNVYDDLHFQNSDLFPRHNGRRLEDDEDERPGDDILPDYVQSQLETAAKARQAATRRAQELAMRWQLSSGRG